MKFRNGLLKIRIRGVKNFLKPRKFNLSIRETYLTIYQLQIQEEPRFAPETFSVAPHGSNWTHFRAVWQHGKNNLANSMAEIKQKYKYRLNSEAGKISDVCNKQIWRKLQVWINFHPLGLNLRSPASAYKLQHHEAQEFQPTLPQHFNLIHWKTYIAISLQLNQFKPSIATSSASVALLGFNWVAPNSTLQPMEPRLVQC